MCNSPVTSSVCGRVTLEGGFMLVIYCFVPIGMIVSGVTTAGAQYPVETLTQYVFPNHPEGIALDENGNVFAGMVLTGEIHKRAPDGTESSLAMIPTAPLGLVASSTGDVYATLVSHFPPPTPPNPDTHGVWHIQSDGTAGRLAALPVETWPNDVILDENGKLFVSDSILGIVYRISSDGTLENWIADPLLLGDPNTTLPTGPIGANGLAFVGSNLFVNNTTVGSIVRVPVQPDGSAGVPTLSFSDPRLLGADGLAADGRGNLYVANIVQNTVLRVAPDGAIDILADMNDGLDGPSSLELNRNRDQEIFLVNSGFFTFAAGIESKPSLMRIVIPEPSTFVLTACGLLCLFGHATRRREHPRS